MKIQTVEKVPTEFLRKRGGGMCERNKLILEALQSMNGKPLSMKLDTRKEKTSVTAFIYHQNTKKHCYACNWDDDTLTLYVSKNERIAK